MQPTAQVPGVRDPLPVGQRGQTGQAEIDADTLPGLHPLDGLNVHAHRHVEPTGRMPHHGHRRRITRNRAADAEFERSEFGHGQPLPGPVEPERRTCIRGAISRPAFLLEGRIRRSLGKEVGEGGVQMPHGLLQGNGGHFVEKRHLRVLFHRREPLIRRGVSHALACAKGSGASSQHAVVDQTTTAEGLRQVFSLGVGRIGSECPTTFHASDSRPRFLLAINSEASARVIGIVENHLEHPRCQAQVRLDETRDAIAVLDALQVAIGRARHDGEREAGTVHRRHPHARVQAAVAVPGCDIRRQGDRGEPLVPIVPNVLRCLVAETQPDSVKQDSSHVS